MQRFNPHPYQEQAIIWLLQNSYAGLLFSPGLGKTACTLAALSVLKSKGMMKRALVVAPRRVINSVWPAEIAKWTDFAGLSCEILHGPAKDTRLAKTTADICLVTPEGLSWLHRNPGHMKLLGADILIIDESSYFRHTTSNRFKILKTMLPSFRRRYLLTGTPMPRSYEDLFPQAYILDMGGALGRFISHYRAQYFYDVGRGYPDWRLQEGAAARINERLRPLMLREDALDHLRMPDLVYNTVTVKLNVAVRMIYDQFEKEFYLLHDGKEVLAPNAAVAVNKLRQAANGFMYGVDQDIVWLHDEKIDAVKQIVDELMGQPVLILYEYKHDLMKLRAAFPNAQVIGGGTSDKQAQAAIDGFNDGSLQILLAHPGSAGHGINIQDRASNVIWFGPTWNLEYFDQAIARVWRQGNPNSRVIVHTVVVEDSVEQDVAAVLATKDRSQQALLASLKRPQPVVAAGTPNHKTIAPAAAAGA